MKRKTLLLTRKEYLKISTMLTTLREMDSLNPSMDLQWYREKGTKLTTAVAFILDRSKINIETSPIRVPNFCASPRVRREVHNSISEFMTRYGFDEAHRFLNTAAPLGNKTLA